MKKFFISLLIVCAFMISGCQDNTKTTTVCSSDNYKGYDVVFTLNATGDKVTKMEYTIGVGMLDAINASGKNYTQQELDDYFNSLSKEELDKVLKDALTQAVKNYKGIKGIKAEATSTRDKITVTLTIDLETVSDKSLKKVGIDKQGADYFSLDSTKKGFKKEGLKCKKIK